jgi:hypothetical protein
MSKKESKRREKSSKNEEKVPILVKVRVERGYKEGELSC